MTSRVVPASSDTIATSRLASAFSSDDLPALGGPAMTMRKPSRRRSPRWSARWRAIDGAQAVDDGAGLDRDVGRHVAFVGEVEPGLDQRLRAEQLRAPAFVELPQRAFRLRQRLTPLRLGLGIDQIGQTFDLGEIELAVLERAAGELAGLGKPHAGEGEQRIEHGADHGAAAMQLQLGHVLAGEARRRREPQHEAAVELRGRGGPMSRKAAWRGGGTPPHKASSASRVPGPDTRITATAASPGPLASATMVSFGATILRLHCVILGRNRRKGHAGADRR